MFAHLLKTVDEPAQKSCSQRADKNIQLLKG